MQRHELETAMTTHRPNLFIEKIDRVTHEGEPGALSDDKPVAREATISHSDARFREIALSIAAQGRQFADGHTVIADAELYRQFLTGTEASVEIEGHRFTFEQAEAIENYVQYRLEDARTNDRLNRSEP